ncbi:putative ribonuclease H-like domain-containing protein [Tanacetum coccineum]
MELENSQNNALAKLPMLKLGEYEMWENPYQAILSNPRLTALWEYVDAQSMFAAIKARFKGNEATKKTQKALLKQQLQKLVSRLTILGVVTPPEDLNVKFLRSLPSEWDTHVIVWMNKPDFDTMGLDDLYNNFKIVEQKVKRSTGAINDENKLGISLTIQKLESRVARSKAVRIEDAFEKAMCAIDGTGFDWSDMAEGEIQANIDLMDCSDSNDTSFKASTYKRGLSIFEGKILKYKESEVLFSEEIALLKRSVGLEEFKQPEVNEYGPRDSSLKPTTVCGRESDNSKENTDDSLTQQPKNVTETSSVMSPLKVTDDEEEVEHIPKVEKKTVIPTATKKEPVKPEKPIRRSISCPNAYKHMVPRAVLMKIGLKNVDNAKPLNTIRSVNTVRPFSTARSVNTVRPYYTAHPKSIVSCARPKTHIQNQAQSTVQRPFYKSTTLTKRSNNQNRNTGRQTINTVRPNVNTVRARGFNVVKPSACWVWRPIKPNGASLSNSQLNDKGFVDSGCSRHMSGNIAHLSDFKDFDGGYVTFGGGANGGRITGKGTIKTDKLDFEDVYFVKELKFNLFSVSQMCDKKNYVLFTDSECLVLSPNFKLPDESQILLKIPRQNNMYSFDMKNIVPKDGLTCLVAKATSEESMLWHRRLGHVNFKNINKLVKENLVRDLPLKRFENDQTCVACLKGKQHRASCKTKAFSPTTKPLFMLHMDLFGPTFVSSLMHKKYCLVVTDDYSRFSWVFFLRTKDETSEILKNFIKEIENLVDKKVKIIRSDNGTEFKNHVMDEFCREKGIKREYSVARTPQQNGVAERKNRTLIEAARTMLADSKILY